MLYEFKETGILEALTIYLTSTPKQDRLIIEQKKAEKKGEELTWRFSCDNNAIKTKWVSYLAQLKDFFQKEHLKVENLLHYTQLE